MLRVVFDGVITRLEDVSAPRSISLGKSALFPELQPFVIDSSTLYLPERLFGMLGLLVVMRRTTYRTHHLLCKLDNFTNCLGGGTLGYLLRAKSTSCGIDTGCG